LEAAWVSSNEDGVTRAFFEETARAAAPKNLLARNYFQSFVATFLGNESQLNPIPNHALA
jgi:hypothetical protein